MKVTLTPSKEGEEEPVDQILTLESDGEEVHTDERTRKTPTLWEKSLLMTEQPDEYDSDDDPEYVPPAVIVDTDLEYDEVILLFLILYFTLLDIVSKLLDGESYEISDTEMQELEADAKMDATELAPRCYMPIWVPVESPAERITRAKEQFAAVMEAKAKKAQMEVDTSCKDTDSNGKKDDEGKIDEATVNKLTSMVGHMHLETGLTPSMKKLSVQAKTEEDCNDGSPKPRRERKKSTYAEAASPQAPTDTTDNEKDEKSTNKEEPSEPIEKKVDPTAS